MDSTLILTIVGSIVIGILAAVGVGFYFRHNMNHVPNPVETTGEVMEVESIEVPNINPINRLFGSNEEAESNMFYHPVIRFRVEGQKMVRFRNRKGFKRIDEYKKGDQVKVLYSANNPLIARLLED